MKSSADRTSIDPAAYGSLMDPAFLRRAVDDSSAFANVTHDDGHHWLDWADLRHRAQALRDWMFHRAAH